MPTMNTASLRAAAATIASASSLVSAIGFSRKTLLPAASARSAYSRWSGVGQADVDGVDGWIADRAVEIGGHLGADDLGHPCGPLGCAGRDRLDAHPLAERLVVRGVGRAHEARRRESRP